MSGPEAPGNPPPEMPEEYLAAYTEAYRRALEEEAPAVVDDAPLAVEKAATPVAPVERVPVENADYGRPPTVPPLRPRQRPAWLPALLLGLLAVALVLGAYGVGRLVSGGTDAPAREPIESPAANRSSSTPDGAWGGAVEPVLATAARATCTARPGVDAAGEPVRYRASNTIDSDPSTAWRCAGRAIGEKVSLTLPPGTEVAEVGIIPGYAKTDPASGTDRYAENNRITRVRWTFGDGVVVEQRLDPDPRDRAVQRIRVPATRTDRITLEILAVAPGARNTTAISEAAVAAVAAD